MRDRISIDKAGRVVLPKALCDKMGLGEGDDLLIEREGERIILRPVRVQPDASIRT